MHDIIVIRHICREKYGSLWSRLFRNRFFRTGAVAFTVYRKVRMSAVPQEHLVLDLDYGAEVPLTTLRQFGGLLTVGQVVWSEWNGEFACILREDYYIGETDSNEDVERDLALLGWSKIEDLAVSGEANKYIRLVK